MLDILCLTVAIFFEARGEPVEGQEAVAQVILNRVEHESFPDNVCDVVLEEDQFSFVGEVDYRKMFDEQSLHRATEIASEVALEVYKGYTDPAERMIAIGSTHYHADYVDPYWAREFDLDGIVGSHIFYTCTTGKC